MQKNDDFPFLSASAASAIKQRLDTKSIQTLLGICTGITVDEYLYDKEIIYLRTWLTEHPETTPQWPGNAIASRIDAILADKIITEAERSDLLNLLQSITGNFFSETGAAAPESPALPIDDGPSIFFRYMTFCFTGKFIYGTRASCERVILNLGGMALDNVSRKLNYLVIGAMIEPTWVHTTYGRKIESAARLRDEGTEICIVSERQWVDALKDATRGA